MKRENSIKRLVLSLGLMLVTPCTLVTQIVSAGERTYPNNVYWGDTHLHTSLSYDGFSMSMASGPDDAYRFARGEAVLLRNGAIARLRRPLDFLVVADHAENLGLNARLEQGDTQLLRTAQGQKLHGLLTAVINAENTPQENDRRLALEKAKPTSGPVGDIPYRRSVWAEVTATADRHNKPGKFTAFSGFEWTPTGTGSCRSGGPSHRVVVFKDGKDKVEQTLPYSKLDSEDPEDLWNYLERYQRKTGGEALAILHNSNLSFGKCAAFITQDFDGKPFTNFYAETRQRWEPLVEATQRKGDSETHPILSPTDEFADFETWISWMGSYYDKTQLSKTWLAVVEKSTSPEGLPYRYVRSALKLGLQQQAGLGVNPFKFGLIGSTDSHSELSTADNDNYILKRNQTFLGSNVSMRKGWEQAAAGYAGVWAEENTREALFAAMKRKEVYASTGPRMTVRFFGGWDYQAEDAFRPDFARIGYAGGVPMGGDLSSAPKGKVPHLLIRAVKDPDGANLDRLQVIKGWRSVDGVLHEKVYDVALSNERAVGRRGKAKPVGNTVDVKDASYTNTIGDAELAVMWQDPDFDPEELAFYYVRVLEIPTPRWTAYHAKTFGVDPKDIPKEVPLVTQERAYTSPIWYSP